MKTPANYYILIPLNKVYRLWQGSGRGCTFGNYCEVLRLLGVRIICFFVLLAGFGGQVSAQVVIDMAKIAQIESSGNPLAFNRNSQARGLHQVTPICLQEYNERNKTLYNANDLFDAKINTKIADWYMNKRIPQMLKHFGLPSDSVTHRLWAYNAGIGMVKRGIMPVETRNYIKKYERR